MMNKSRNVLMILLILLFTFAAACGDDDEKSNNGNNANNVNNSQDQDAGNNGEDDASDEEDVEEQDTTPPPPTCEPLSPAVGSCDALCNTGCGEGQACMTAPTQSGAVESTCVATGPGGQGDACGATGCQEGFACLSEDGVTASCLQYCRPNVNDATQCDSGLVCVGFSESTPGIGVCIPAPDDGCTIFPNAGCGEGEQCYNAQGGGTICAPFNADAESGDSCSAANDCNENQICAGSTAGGSCMDMCDSPGTGTCEDGGACQPLTGASFGVCAIGN